MPPGVILSCGDGIGGVGDAEHPLITRDKIVTNTKVACFLITLYPLLYDFLM